jgi:hypothetical protein
MRHDRGLAASPGVIGILIVGRGRGSLFRPTFVARTLGRLIHNRQRISCETVITQLLEHEIRKIGARSAFLARHLRPKPALPAMRF